MAEHAKIHPEQHWTPGLEDWIDELDILSIDKCGHDGEISDSAARWTGGSSSETSNVAGSVCRTSFSPTMK